MPDDVRVLSLRVEATQAINGLIKGANALDILGSATGKTDAQLRKVDSTLQKSAQLMASAARTTVALRNEITGLQQSTTRLNTANAKVSSLLITANKKLAEQKQIVSTQTAVIRALVKDTIAQAAAYDRLASSAARASAATNKVASATSRSGYSPLASQFANAAPLKSNGMGSVSPLGTTALSDINKANNALGAAGESANALRYQLYSVAATLGILGAKTLEAGTAIFRTGIEFDKNFANVIRTSQVTGRAVSWLRDQFLQLQTEVPVSSADLATIATLGAQMGVSAANLANFTKITAEFAATAEVGVDEAATAMSRLDQLLPDVEGNYSKLASAILKTGVNAVATEAQIIRGTSQIAAIGRIAGLTTPEIVALSSAMSSLGFSPELQRSVITSSFSRILTATSSVTAQTEKFGSVLHLTGTQFKEAWNKDAVGTYEKLLKTIAGRGDAVTVLQGLGLASQRLTPNLLKLGQNTDVLDKALRDTETGWTDNTELQRQYGIISRTVAARIQIMQQSWEALLVTLDNNDGIGIIVDTLTGLLRLLRQLATTPGLSTMVSIAAVLVSLGGITSLAIAGLAGLTAGYLALTQVLEAAVIAQSVDTTAVVANTEARVVFDGVLGSNVVALDAATAATITGAAATDTAAISMVGFTAKSLAALPAILKWTGIVGLAAASAVGLYTALQTIPDWTNDLDKAVNGVTNVKQTLKFDTKALKKQFEVNAYDQRQLVKSKVNPGSTVLSTDNYKSAIVGDKERTRGLYKDLEDSLLEITDAKTRLVALNTASANLGMTNVELLKHLPGLASALGDEGAAMADAAAAADILESATSLWAASLGTGDEELTALMENVKSSAASFLDFGSALTNAYDTSGDVGTGGGINAFIKNMNAQITSFQTFYTQLGTLVQHGGVQLASFFASQGPAAAQALTDSLKLNDNQIGQIESQMSLAAFYASDAFKQTFAQNNSLLADVWTASGHNPAAVKAFNDALAASMKGGVIDPAAIAALEKQFGISIPVGFIPDLDPETLINAELLLNDTVTPITVPVVGDVGGIPEQLQQFIVTENGHTIVLNVDPNTVEGSKQLNAWRANQYQTPVTIPGAVTLDAANAKLLAFRQWWNKQSIVFQVATSYAYNSGTVGGIPGGATGAYVGKSGLRRNNYPGYARGTILNGPGSGTSDSMLARVSTGEAITQARAVRYYGSRYMEDLNHMRIPRYASGYTPHVSASASGGSGTVRLDAYSIKMLSRGGATIYLDGRVLADATSGADRKNNNRGRG